MIQACANNPTNPTATCDTDDAEVPYTDVSSAPTLVKTAAATACRIDQTYDVAVNNTNAAETLTLNSLTDDIFGNITQTQGNVISTNCAVPQTIAAAGSYSCSFVGRSTTCSGTVVDTVTGGTTDEDGVAFSPSDTATVVISVTKP